MSTVYTAARGGDISKNFLILAVALWASFAFANVDLKCVESLRKLRPKKPLQTLASLRLKDADEQAAEAALNRFYVKDGERLAPGDFWSIGPSEGAHPLQLILERGTGLTSPQKLEAIRALKQFHALGGQIVVAGKNNRWCGAAAACFVHETAGMPPKIVVTSLLDLRPETLHHELRHFSDFNRLLAGAMRKEPDRKKALANLESAIQKSPALSRFYEDRAFRDFEDISLKQYGIEMELRHLGRLLGGKFPAEGTPEYQKIVRLLTEHARIQEWKLPVPAQPHGPEEKDISPVFLEMNWRAANPDPTPHTFRKYATHLSYFDQPHDAAVLDHFDRVFAKEVLPHILAPKQAQLDKFHRSIGLPREKSTPEALLSSTGAWWARVAGERSDGLMSGTPSQLKRLTDSLRAIARMAPNGEVQKALLNNDGLSFADHKARVAKVMGPALKGTTSPGARAELWIAALSLGMTKVRDFGELSFANDGEKTAMLIAFAAHYKIDRASGPLEAKFAKQIAGLGSSDKVLTRFERELEKLKDLSDGYVMEGLVQAGRSVSKNYVERVPQLLAGNGFIFEAAMRPVFRDPYWSKNFDHYLPALRAEWAKKPADEKAQFRRDLELYGEEEEMGEHEKSIAELLSRLD